MPENGGIFSRPNVLSGSVGAGTIGILVLILVQFGALELNSGGSGATHGMLDSLEQRVAALELRSDYDFPTTEGLLLAARVTNNEKILTKLSDKMETLTSAIERLNTTLAEYNKR